MAITTNIGIKIGVQCSLCCLQEWEKVSISPVHIKRMTEDTFGELVVSFAVWMYTKRMGMLIWKVVVITSSQRLLGNFMHEGGMLGSRACSEVFHQSDFLSTSRRARPKPCHMLKPGFCRGKEVNIRSILMLRFIYLFKKIEWHGEKKKHIQREKVEESKRKPFICWFTCYNSQVWVKLTVKVKNSIHISYMGAGTQGLDYIPVSFKEPEQVAASKAEYQGH